MRKYATFNYMNNNLNYETPELVLLDVTAATVLCASNEDFDIGGEGGWDD